MTKQNDDIDDLVNKRVKTVGEILGNQIRDVVNSIRKKVLKSLSRFYLNLNKSCDLSTSLSNGN
jgi:DNA-directed RNA polymerase beta subunit